MVLPGGVAHPPDDPARVAPALAEFRPEPGEVALRGAALDLFPAADAFPVRIELAEDAPRIAALHRFDPLTQRSTDPATQVTLHPATEHRLDAAEVEEAAELMANPDAAELSPEPDTPAPAAPEPTPERVVPVLTLLPGAPAYCDPEVPDR